MLKGPAAIPTASEAIIIDIPNNLLRRRPDTQFHTPQFLMQTNQGNSKKRIDLLS
ncbi:conserved hypothetical protein [delta proteobacterium NaphS2]|nr:conserved hypothetical protein [delta proteobacterium NaphS2]